MPEFEIEGCYLIEDAVATALVGDCSNYCPARRRRPARMVEPLAARAADREGRLTQRVHLGRRPVRLDAAVARTPPGAPYLREPGDDGAARSTRLRDAERPQRTSSPHSTTRRSPARPSRRRQVLATIIGNAASLFGTPARVPVRRRRAVGRARAAGPSATTSGYPSACGHRERGKESPAGSWETGKSFAVNDYSSWAGRLGLHSPADPSALSSLRRSGGGKGRRRASVSRTSTVARSRQARWRCSSGSRSSPLSRSRTARLYAALQQSEELHRQIVDCSTDLISVVDLEGTIVVMSPSAFGTLGIQPQDMVGTYFAGLVHPDDLGGAQEMFGEGDGRRVRDHDRSCPPRRRQLGPARRDRERDRRPGRAATAHPRHGPRRDRSPPARGAAAPGAEDGVGRPACGWHRTRLQQPAHRDPRLRRADADRLRHGCRPGARLRRADRTRRRPRRIADRPAARVQPQAGTCGRS